jgi:uncharacterized repeat protein (TIGR03803 family)
MPSARKPSILQAASRLSTPIVAVILATFLLAAAHRALAQVETVLYSFGNNGTDGYSPYAGLALDAEGNLYGTTYLGGVFNNCNGGSCGTVFKVTPSGNETILHSFAGGRTDGCFPDMAGVVLDDAGNLYGTTNGCGSYGSGVVYKLTPSGNETILHSFSSADGNAPFAGVLLDKAGNIYGTTNGGGAHRCGVVYKLTPDGIETILYSFVGAFGDGCFPMGGLVLVDNALYGTTYLGGRHGVGAVFKLRLSGTETVLHSFSENGIDGTYPEACVALDKAGNIYGTTYQGGVNHIGTVYKLTPSGTETILHSFPANDTDGTDPYFAALILDKLGNLYGVTNSGGASGGGTVFEINSSGTETILHSFSENGTDGFFPLGVVLGKMNTLYGVTDLGGTKKGQGTNGGGTVFKMVLQTSITNGSIP